jgi:D-alanine transaminase
MAAIAYVNGRYRPLREAAVNVEDRGFQFGDGIYEVLYVHNHRLADAGLHLSRLTRSLGEIGLTLALSPAALLVVIREVLRRNRVSTGLVYMQITRGVARRDHPFPAAPVRPGIVITARHRPAPPADIARWTGAAITLPDERWARCDIKSTNLLPNVLARQKARLAGAYEAILYDAQGYVTEGAASNVWIVDAGGTLRTRPLGQEILPGCTRAAVLEMLHGADIAFAQAPFTLEALRGAREIFLTSATSFVKPITRLDGVSIGNGHPGPAATLLLDRYLRHIEAP